VPPLPTDAADYTIIIIIIIINNNMQDDVYGAVIMEKPSLPCGLNVGTYALSAIGYFKIIWVLILTVSFH